MSERRIVRRFAAALPLFEEAKERLTRESCPRRYCWYWDKLGFDWEISPEQGCRVAEQHMVGSYLKDAGVEIQPWRQCCRASGNPQHPDFYEPREPHLEADGWPVDFFKVVGKAARTRRYERRERGGRRRSDDA